MKRIKRKETNPIPTVEHLLSDESFQRWLNGLATSEEDKEWELWLQSDYRHQELLQQAKKLWKLVQFQPAIPPDINQELKKLKIRLTTQDNYKPQMQRLSSHRSPLIPTAWHSRPWLRYAAVAAMIVMIFLGWYYLRGLFYPNRSDYQIVSTDYGQRVRLTLPEGSLIILNANSTLKYPVTWNKNTIRQFELQGEAYFMVSPLLRGVQRNFCVKTKDGSIQVVGTRFAVHERGGGTRVAVEKGRVKVYVPFNSTKEKGHRLASVLLESGYLLKFKKGDTILCPNSENIKVYTSWCTDELVFDNTAFENIIQRLQDTYGATIKVTNNELLKRSISGSIENTNLQTIITALAKALQVPVQREGNVIIFGKS